MSAARQRADAPRGTEPRAYACFGRVYRVERAGRPGMWWAAGRARGQRAAFLDRLGPRPTREAMQATLDAWAAKRGLRPLGGGGHGEG